MKELGMKKKDKKGTLKNQKRREKKNHSCPHTVIFAANKFILPVQDQIWKKRQSPKTRKQYIETI